tara:strand:- start:2007 stop:2180 length:174 start_codon:yes stop_codon:yes gene_type:complete
MCTLFPTPRNLGIEIFASVQDRGQGGLLVGCRKTRYERQYAPVCTAGEHTVINTNSI